MNRSLFVDTARNPLFIAATAVWLAIPLPAHGEYVCLPRTVGGDSYLVLRTGPGPEYPEIGPMANRTVVTVINQQNVWVYIRTGDGNAGWANRQGICLDTPEPER